MNERKYVILKNDDTGKEYAVIFDRDLSHSAVAHGVMRGMAGNDWGPRVFLEPVAAGFIDKDMIVYPDRGSESLKLEPRPVDQVVLNGGQPISVEAKEKLAVLAKKILAPKQSKLARLRGTKARL